MMIENNVVTIQTEEKKEISIQRLENIKTEIEKMTKKNNIEVLRLLKKHNSIKLNENKNGVFVNITLVPNEVIFELEKYIQYVKDQETTFQELETQKKEYIDAYMLNNEDIIENL